MTARRAVAGLALAVAAALGIASCGERPAPAHRPAAAAPISGCGSDDSRDLVLTDSGVGPLRLGESAAALRARCTVVREAVETNHDYVERESIMVVRLGPDTVVAAIHRGVVDRFDVASPRFRTSDTLGAGLRLATFRTRAGATAAIGEASVSVSVPDHCGLAFILGGASDGETQEVPAAELARWPDTLRVTKVWVSGCPR